MTRCIITVYYLVDNFCKIYEEWIEHRLLSTNQQRHRIGKLSLAELMTIVIYFYLSPCKDFKNYYLPEFWINLGLEVSIYKGQKILYIIFSKKTRVSP